MSVAYGGAPGGAGYPVPRRVNFGWIGEAFELFKANIPVWLVATLLLFVPSIISAIVQGAAGGFSPANQPAPGSNPFSSRALTGNVPPGIAIGLQIFNTLYGAWLSAGIYGTAVKQVRGEMISIGDLFSGGPNMWRMLGFNIIYGIAVVIGFIFLIIPGILISGLLFPAYALIADGESVGNALTRSGNGMKQDLWNAAGFVIVMGLLQIAGVLALCVGLFVTMPMFYLAAALAYRDMIGMPGLNQGIPAYGSAPGVWPPAPSAAPPPQWGSTPETPQAYPKPPDGNTPGAGQ